MANKYKRAIKFLEKLSYDGDVTLRSYGDMWELTHEGTDTIQELGLMKFLEHCKTKFLTKELADKLPDGARVYRYGTAYTKSGDKWYSSDGPVTYYAELNEGIYVLC